MRNWLVTYLDIDSLMKIFTEFIIEALPVGYPVGSEWCFLVYMLSDSYHLGFLQLRCFLIVSWLLLLNCERVVWRCMIFVGCYNLFTVTLTELKNVMKMKKTANILLSIYVTGMTLSALHKVSFNPYINSTR